MKKKRIKENMFNQMNKEYLQNLKLPELNKIANTAKIIKKIANGTGEKYNPHTNVYVYFNRTKRNYTGSLFQH